jgi:hypothetical protein
LREDIFVGEPVIFVSGRFIYAFHEYIYASTKIATKHAPSPPQSSLLPALDLSPLNHATPLLIFMLKKDTITELPTGKHVIMPFA